MFIEDEIISEQRRQYTRKNIETNLLRNPSLKCNALQFIKPFEERHLKTAPKPLFQHISVYNEDYKGQTEEQDGKLLSLTVGFRAIENSEKLTIDRTKPGYVKYLDTSATSNKLNYIPYSFEQKHGIGAQDNITYWTWIKNGPYGNKNVWPVKQKSCVKSFSNKRKTEFQILQNTVPISGLSTETKANYKTPDATMNFDFECIFNMMNQ